MLRIENLKIYEDLLETELYKRALKKAGIRQEDVLTIAITRKSIDARDKRDVHYLYSFNVEVKKEAAYPKLKKVVQKPRERFEIRRNSQYRPIIIGAGPAGLFCALTLVEYGFKPIIIEQGSCVEKRRNVVEEYLREGKLNPLCNVQFGEGGAGAFSDGKLTTGISSGYIQTVLELFHRFGAPKEVTYLAKPHIGTDNLYHILINMRKYILEKGGEYHFDTCFKEYIEEKDCLRVITDKGEFRSDALVLAIGHSARPVFRMLKTKGVSMKRKNFAVGVRVEHLQSMINKSQYGEFTKLKLPPAEYKLVEHVDERVCYTFCMCPGGEVIASSSDSDGIVTNGMSYYARDGVNANAALLVNVGIDDLPGDDVLAGIDFQEELEKKAYQAGGAQGYAPIQRIEDFFKGQPSDHFGRVKPTYRPGTTFYDLNHLFPEYVSDTLKKGILAFDRRLKGFNDPDGLLTGVETRTSSPVTIERSADFVASAAYIYPCGEGAGYAGGITSAAIDGIKVARAIIEKESKDVRSN